MPFDDRARGILPGEAVAVVVLRRLSRAVSEQDPIYALLPATGINYDGKTNGITSPNGASQAELLGSTWKRCPFGPDKLSYIVAHGTGTRLGDPVEVNALIDALAPFTSRREFCALTSPKTNFGHTFAASGLVSLISLIQAMRHQAIPPSLNFQRPNPYIPWRKVPFSSTPRSTPWKAREGETLKGAVSAFGMSGTNAHAVVESHSRTPGETRPLPFVLLPLSARTPKALDQRIRDLSAFLSRNPHESLSEIAYTLQTGRTHFNHRCAVVAGMRTMPLNC